MSAKRSTEIQVGLALVVALAVLVFGLMWFQEYQIGAQYAQIRVHFPKVGGLGAGDPVQVRGIDMGKVTSVDLADEGVVVRLRVEGAVVLREDSEIVLGSAGIMGERMVAIEPGSGEPVDPEGRIFEGTYEASSTELVGQFEKFNEQVMGFLDRADAVLASLQEDGTLVKTLQSTTRVAETASEVLQDNRADLERATRALAGVAERVDRFLDEHGEAMGEGVDGLARTTASLDSLTRRMNVVLDGTQDVLTALREQRGPAGRMIYDEAAGENLVESLEKLRFLVEDLQRNPQRYLTVEIF